MAIRAVLQPDMVQVKDGPFLSKLIVQHDGVPQGDKLSPLLFSIFIADLEPNLSKKFHTVFYADDLIIGSHISQDVQEVLQSLEVYCEDNLMSVNVEKTKAVKLRNGKRLSADDDLIYKNMEIEFVPEFYHLVSLSAPN